MPVALSAGFKGKGLTLQTSAPCCIFGCVVRLTGFGGLLGVGFDGIEQHGSDVLREGQAPPTSCSVEPCPVASG